MKDGSDAGTRRLVLALALVAAVLALLPFLPALHGGWIWDDHPLIETDPYVHSLHWFGRWFTTDFWAVNAEQIHYGTRVAYWRPLIMTSYAVDWRLSGGSPLWFHVMNLVWQGAAGGLAFVTLRRWIGATWPAFLAAVLFAVHPTKAESVAWIAGRTDVLCLVFVLLASEGIGRRLRGARGGLALEVVGSILAYMAKEQAIVLPIFAAVEAWVALGRPPLDRVAIKRCLKVALPQVGVAVGYLVFRAAWMPIKPHGKPVSLGLFDHAAAVLETIGRYVALTFAPHDLSVQQALVESRHRHILHSTPYIALGAVALAVLVAVAVAARRRWPAVTIGIAFYLGALLPTSNVVYTQMVTLVSERFLYLPLLGLALVLGAVLATCDPTWRRRGFALGTACALALAGLSASRSADFADEDAFWARELRLHPQSISALGFFIERAVKQREFSHVLELLGRLKTGMAPYDSHISVELEIAADAVFALSELTPDHDVAALRKLDAFCQALLEQRGKPARLDVGGVDLTTGTGSGPGYLRALKPYVPQLEKDRAEIASRLGDDADALRLAAATRDACRWCQGGVVEDVLAHARAGQYDAAIAILDEARDHVDDQTLAQLRSNVETARAEARTAATTSGPAHLDARAQELAYLELWGRAYDTLAPAEAELVTVPHMARAYAELAFRAGERQVAQRVLATIESPQDIERDFGDWADQMGWSQAP